VEVAFSQSGVAGKEKEKSRTALALDVNTDIQDGKVYGT